MTYLIALVEDSPAEAELLKKYFRRYCADNHAEIELRCFDKGETFLLD